MIKNFLEKLDFFELEKIKELSMIFTITAMGVLIVYVLLLIIFM
jgi:hypothetical protein